MELAKAFRSTIRLDSPPAAARTAFGVVFFADFQRDAFIPGFLKLSELI
jgi:hypothetical protein